MHEFALQAKVNLFFVQCRIQEHLLDPVLDRLAIVGHKQNGVVRFHIPGVLFNAVHHDLDNAVLGSRHVVAAVLVTAPCAHPGNGDVGLALGEAVALELLHQLIELHTADIVGYAPQSPHRRIGHNARRLGINELVVIGQARLSHLGFVVLFVDGLDGRAHDSVVTRHHGILEAQVDVPLLIEGALEKPMGPGLYLFNGIGRQHPGVALFQAATVHLHRITTAADKHHLGDASGLAQLAVAEVQATGFHGVDLDIPVDPIGPQAPEIAKLNVFPGDIAADPLADRAVGGLGRQLVQAVLGNVRVLAQQIVQLGSVHGHARILDTHTVGLQRIDGFCHHRTIAGEPLLRGQIDLDKFDVQMGANKLVEYALKGNLSHLITVQHHQWLFDLNCCTHH